MSPADSYRVLLRLGLGTLCGLWLSLSSGVAQDTPPPSRASGLLAASLQAAQTGNWAEAEARVTESDQISRDILHWLALREGQGSFAEYMAFLRNKNHWPLINTVQRQAEELLTTQTPEAILEFFELWPPVSEEGQIALTFALKETGQTDRAEALAIDLWQGEFLSGEHELRLLRSFGDALDPYHADRVDMLLWQGARTAAQRHLERLPEAEKAVARARIALQERVSGVDPLVAAVPASHANDPGLMRDRFEFRIRVGNVEGAIALIHEQSRHAAGLGQPEAWGARRVALVRRAMSEGDFALAYDLATPNGLEDGLHFVDLEFLAGFIALTHLDRPQDALNHFRTLRVRSSSPISLGRAGYWEGRAQEALGNADLAEMSFAFAAEHQTSFYGQLAADRLGLTLDPVLVNGDEHPNWRDTSLAESDLLQAALLLHEAGQWHQARRFVLFLARQLDDAATLGALADLMLEIKEPNFALNIAKIAVQSEIVLPRAYFPLTDLAKAELPVPADLVKAIARRESEFDPGVVSPADARGLMQVLPGTGEMMASKLGVPFQVSDLISNPDLNARLGAAYLEELRDEFGTSLALVAAGYNAGPGRPRQWIPRLGDPRDENVDLIAWVESVPFAETRNYIMRVAESQVVYRSRLVGSPQPIEMHRLLRGD